LQAAPEVVPILTEAEAKAAKKKKQDDKEFEVAYGASTPSSTPRLGK
jgi:hypothetical protein